MSEINFLGSYSGIDSSTIDQLMAIEKKPLIQMSEKITSYEEEKDAWRDINTRLNSLSTKIEKLQDVDLYKTKIATSTDEDIISMSASNDAVEGKYFIDIDQLATNSRIISGDIALADHDNTKSLGITGSFTLENHDNTSFQVDIESSDSLNDIVQKININSEDTGLSATLIDSRLVILDETTGERNITITDDGNDTLSKLGLSDVLRTWELGKNSLFTVNGIDVERTSNTITDVINNVTIKLNNESSTTEVVNITKDKNSIKDAVTSFVEQYNSTMEFIESKLTVGDPDVEGSKGTLAGDGTLMRLQSNLRSLISSSITNEDTTISNISELGIKTVDIYGTINFNETDFMDKLESNPEDVMNFFISENDEEIGFSPKINDYIDSFIDTSGIIKSKTDSYDRSIKSFEKDVESFNQRMELREAYFISVFSKLDTALMQAEQQMSWMSSQLASLNGNTSDE